MTQISGLIANDYCFTNSPGRAHPLVQGIGDLCGDAVGVPLEKMQLHAILSTSQVALHTPTHAIKAFLEIGGK